MILIYTLLTNRIEKDDRGEDESIKIRHFFKNLENIWLTENSENKLNNKYPTSVNSEGCIY